MAAGEMVNQWLFKLHGSRWNGQNKDFKLQRKKALLFHWCNVMLSADGAGVMWCWVQTALYEVKIQHQISFFTDYSLK